MVVCSNSATPLRETHVPYGITQCYLPPDRGENPAFTPSRRGTRFSDPGGMQGWVDLCYVKADRPGVDPRPANRKSNALPLSHHVTLPIEECVLFSRKSSCVYALRVKARSHRMRCVALRCGAASSGVRHQKRRNIRTMPHSNAQRPRIGRRLLTDLRYADSTEMISSPKAEVPHFEGLL